MKISNFKLIGKNTLVAAFDVSLPSGITIHGMMLQRNGDAEWIAFPGREYLSAGKKAHANLISIPDGATRDRFKQAVIAALKAEEHI